MLGWLIYDAEGAVRNQWFISALIKAAVERGINLVLNPPMDHRPDFAIVRTIQPSLTKKLEAAGIPTFNNYATSHVANDKWLTYELCQRLRISTMPTYRLEDADKLTTPFVLKSLAGHGGADVSLIHDTRELQGVDPTTHLVQEFCSTPGMDMRIYALGGKVLASVLRTSASDFRSNFSLGGQVQEVVATPGQRGIVRALYDELGFDFVGVDFIQHNGQWVLNEIEDVVGARMLYKCTSLDAAALYMDYISKRLNQKQ